MTEVDAIIVAGVATGMAGALVAAPDGARLIVRQAIADIRKTLHRISHPGEWRRRHNTVEGGLRLSGLGHMSGDIKAQVIRNPHTPVEEQLRQLWEAVDRLGGDVGQLKQDLEDADERFGAAIDRVSADVSAARVAFNAA